ncbi:MAG: TlyA family RNA methyltransferase [Armatimonadota bacterium]|nr:TlyA family RNA methyltransferase [Armatimonadota bacterium]
MKQGKVRLDALLVGRGLFPTRSRAQAAILAGAVFVDGKPAQKPGTLVSLDARVEVQPHASPYVSRGGLKLVRALQVFGIDVRGKVAIDVGASTGGFTDCLLQSGASRVYAVDVGYGLLDWRLRNDPRVVVLERTNARFLRPEQIGEPADLITVDLSFISLTKVLPALVRLLKPGGEILPLVKPQFEVGPGKARKGVVRDPGAHREVLMNVCMCARDLGLAIKGITYSPLRGPEGNIEFFLYLVLGASEGIEDLPGAIWRAVEEAHAALSGGSRKAVERVQGRV